MLDLTPYFIEPDGTERIVKLFKESGIKPDFFFQQVEKEIEKKTIYPVHPMHLIVNMISMCIFPFIGKPFLSTFLFQDSESYDQFLEERKNEVPQFIINSIQMR